MLMTPGLAFFYGGLVRSKNVLNTLMMSFAALGIISIQWMLWGYSVAFGPTEIKILGSGFVCQSNELDGAASRGRATPVSNAPTVPGAIFMLFQMTFAIITPALISGAIAERMKFGAYCLFILLWATFFYDPLAHMVWDGGFIGTGQIHALDFAGGTVVHISSGVSALVLCIMLGKRKGHGAEEMRPHNVPVCSAGRGPALVRLVRLQRRFAACGGRRFHGGVYQHPYCDGGCRPVLDDCGMDQVQEADRGRVRVRRGRGPGCHYPGLRLCQSPLTL